MDRKNHKDCVSYFMVIILINDLKPLYTNSCSHTYTYGQSNYVKVIRKKDFSILGQKYIISKK